MADYSILATLQEGAGALLGTSDPLLIGVCVAGLIALFIGGIVISFTNGGALGFFAGAYVGLIISTFLGLIPAWGIIIMTIFVVMIFILTRGMLETGGE